MRNDNIFIPCLRFWGGFSRRFSVALFKNTFVDHPGAAALHIFFCLLLRKIM